MRTFFLGLLIFVMQWLPLKADHYEGVDLFKGMGRIDPHWLTQFLPYNPVVFEAGACYGADTAKVAKTWPKGRIIAFEPNPHAFLLLQKKIYNDNLTNVEPFNLALNDVNGLTTLYVCYGMQGKDPIFEYASSLLLLTKEMEIYCKGPAVSVPCVTLDDWCAENEIDHIDLLHLELEGLELQALRKSPQILKTVKAIWVKTIRHPHRVGMTHYHELKQFLERSQFVLVSHWYKPEIEGQALFLSRELFDAYFKLCLGIYLDH